MTDPRESWYSVETARKVLNEHEVFAVVGCSSDPYRASHEISRVLIANGYEVIPVNPFEKEILGRTCYPDLRSIPGPVDVVDIFRRSDQAGAHVDQAIEIGAKAVWLQIGVIDEEAAERATQAGLEVVMDRCPKVELSRLVRH